MDKRITMYVVTHKETNDVYNEDIYRNIYVGKVGKDHVELSDSTGINISDKNASYCELTAMYWVEKNDKTSEIVGISHYRRFFSKNIISSIMKKKVKGRELNKLMNKYDILVPTPTYTRKENIIEQYGKDHFKKDLLICGEIIEEKYPQYKSSFKKIINGHFYSQYNMIIAKKEIYSEYLIWLFDILFEAEKRIDTSQYDDYNKRIFGFLSERLFNVWLEKNGEKYLVKYLPVYNTEEKTNNLRILARYIRNRMKIIQNNILTNGNKKNYEI